MGESLTIEEGKQALAEHAREKGLEIRAKYGPVMDYSTLLRLLDDRDCVRFPMRLVFDTRRIEPGLFGMMEPEEKGGEKGYVLTLHGHFQDRPDDLVPLVLYHLVSVNYGDFATYEDAEAFGAAVLGMDRDTYYALVCRLTDGIPAGAAS